MAAARKSAPRVRVIHWREEEAGPLREAVGKAGFTVEYTAGRYAEIARAVKAAPPEVIVIDLSRLPSHGCETAIALRNAKYGRGIPFVFSGGAAEKVESVRRQFPQEQFADPDGIGAAIKTAIRNGVQAAPPVAMMDRWAGRTVAQKLGIAEGMAVAVLNAPRDYASVVGPLPEGASLEEEPAVPLPLTLQFVADLREYQAVIPSLRRLAGRTRLWILWRKGGTGEFRLTDKLVREFALEAGLVDYKICALGAPWSGMLFAVRKA